MSCSQGVHFQFIGDKVKNYVLPKNKIYVLPKSEIYVLAKRKTELQTPIIQPSSLEVISTILLLSVEQITELQCLSCD